MDSRQEGKISLIRQRMQVFGQNLKELEKGVNLLSRQLTPTSNGNLQLYARSVMTEESQDELSFCESVVVKDSFIFGQDNLDRKYSEDQTIDSSLRNTKRPEYPTWSKKFPVTELVRFVEDETLDSVTKSVETLTEDSHAKHQGMDKNAYFTPRQMKSRGIPARIIVDICDDVPLDATRVKGGMTNKSIRPQAMTDNLLTNNLDVKLLYQPLEQKRPCKLLVTLRRKSPARKTPVTLGSKSKALRTKV